MMTPVKKLTFFVSAGLFLCGLVLTIGLLVEGGLDPWYPLATGGGSAALLLLLGIKLRGI